MRIRIDNYCADSSERAHTVRKCSFVHEIIQHVEYPMARVAKITEYDTAHLKKQLTPTVTTVTLSSADNSSVRRAQLTVYMGKISQLARAGSLSQTYPSLTCLFRL